MKKLTTAKIWQFAAGQFGWALLSGIISNWLVYFYQPDETAISQGQTIFIPQGLVIFGAFTIIGGITAFGRIFDAFTDPMIASWSDRCTSKNGRRIPFLKGASLPLALSTVLVFWSPANENSWINAAFLFVMILAYYLSITAYCTPYNALIPELGHTQQERHHQEQPRRHQLHAHDDAVGNGASYPPHTGDNADEKDHFHYDQGFPALFPGHLPQLPVGKALAAAQDPKQDHATQ